MATILFKKLAIWMAETPIEMGTWAISMAVAAIRKGRRREGGFRLVRPAPLEGEIESRELVPIHLLARMLPLEWRPVVS